MASHAVVFREFGHRREIRVLTFRGLALRQNVSIRSDEGLTLETSALESLITVAKLP